MMKRTLMPRWSLEVVRMFIYMMFPVTCFHYFNNPQIFEKSVSKLRRETQLPIPPEKQREMKQALEDLKNKMNLKRLQQLEESEK